MNPQDFITAYDAVRRAFGDVHPSWALILGSGWSAALETLGTSPPLSYSEIPGLGGVAVHGHAGELHLVDVADSKGLVFAGRRHAYEGLGFSPIATPIFIAKSMGVQSLLLTNAAGGIHADFVPGDLMLIEDHINMMAQNPLVGAHEAFWGPRFPDQSAVYDPALRALIDTAAQKTGQALKRGTYLATLGPCYETPAEIRAYRHLGADAVGMSTVPEAILAHAAGLRVAGLSCITNFAAGVSETPLSHDEVLAVTEKAKPRMAALLSAICAQLARLPDC